MRIPPHLNTDSYKQWHYVMYPKGMTLLHSNMTARSFKHLGCEESIWFGLQRYIKEYLINHWNKEFFEQPLEKVISEYKRFHKYFSGSDNPPTEQLEALHKLGYLPLEICALPEGTRVPVKVPYYVIHNTVKGFGWLVNFLETPMSNGIWDAVTVATLGDMYRKVLDKWAIKTTGSTDGVEFQGHDFCMRGKSSLESAINQMGWLLFFRGTDTIPSVLALEEYYNANMETEFIAASVPASEHSVMTSYGKENEIDAFSRLLDQFPEGILSIVSDSFDLWQVLCDFLPKLKIKIMQRDGKIVIRPDSGDPVRILCGYLEEELELITTEDGFNYKVIETGEMLSYEQRMGVISLLWETFGGKVNTLGYKVLSEKIGAIYGDSINLKRAEEICALLERKGFASTNVVLGVGSFTMQYTTRDSLGIAVKSTYCEVETVAEEDMSSQGGPGLGETFIEKRNIFKDPITDDGVKKSAKGILTVLQGENGIYLKDQSNWDDFYSESNLLKPVFRNGVLLVDQTLSEIRERVSK